MWQCKSCFLSTLLWHVLTIISTLDFHNFKIELRKCIINPKRQFPCRFEMYLPERSFELHNRSSGVTCGWLSWPKDQSSWVYLCEHHLLSTKACAVRPARGVADPRRHPSRLRREPTQPRQTHCWATSNTPLTSELHYLTWKTRIPLPFEPDFSFDAMHWPIWLQCRFGSWCNVCPITSRKAHAHYTSTINTDK